MCLQCACSVLQCFAVCCSVLQCAALCCSVLYTLDRARASMLRLTKRGVTPAQITCVAVCCSALQFFAVCRSHGFLQPECAAHMFVRARAASGMRRLIPTWRDSSSTCMCCDVLQCAVLCCSVLCALQCVAVCCGGLHCVARMFVRARAASGMGRLIPT